MVVVVEALLLNFCCNFLKAWTCVKPVDIFGVCIFPKSVATFFVKLKFFPTVSDGELFGVTYFSGFRKGLNKVVCKVCLFTFFENFLLTLFVVFTELLSVKIKGVTVVRTFL